MREFHANLHDRIGLIVFIKGVWVPFDSMTINTFFELEDEDNEDYLALYRASNYDLIMKKLTNGRGAFRIKSNHF